jgi:hypothetical protein
VDRPAGDEVAEEQHEQDDDGHAHGAADDDLPPPLGDRLGLGDRLVGLDGRRAPLAEQRREQERHHQYPDDDADPEEDPPQCLDPRGLRPGGVERVVRAVAAAEQQGCHAAEPARGAERPPARHAEVLRSIPRPFSMAAAGTCGRSGMPKCPPPRRDRRDGREILRCAQDDRLRFHQILMTF